MSDIPSELYIEILRRVPVESLFRFRSVCKAWRQIIDNPNFSKHHIRRGIGTYWIFHKHEDKSGNIFLSPIDQFIPPCTSNTNNNNNNNNNYTTVVVNATNIQSLLGTSVICIHGLPVPSCDGLILLSSSNNHEIWRIWNPFTGEYLELEHCFDFHESIFPSYTAVYAGIGYDVSNDDYKVVRMITYHTYVYSLNSNKWHQAEGFPRDASIMGCDGTFAYGALHWMTFVVEEQNGGYNGCIVAFNLSTENYRKIDLPSEITQSNFFCCGVDEFSGCLFLICYDFGGQFVVWMIENYGCGDTWVKIISHGGKSLISIVAYVKSKEQVLLRCSNGKYIWYDLGKQCLEKVGIEVNADGFGDESDCNGYINYHFSTQVVPASLIRLNRSGGSDESIASQGTSTRKIRRTEPFERLPLKFTFVDFDHNVYDDGPTFSDEPTCNPN